MERQRLLFANSSQSKFSDEGAAAVAENRIAAFRETFENRELAFTDEYCYYAWMCASVERARIQPLAQRGLRRATGGHGQAHRAMRPSLCSIGP